MVIAYLTTDDVNASYARRLARGFGLKLRILTPREIDLMPACDILLCDVDALRPMEPEQLINKWLSQFRLGRLALHSYSFSAAQKVALRRKGVLVFRRLAKGVFGRLQGLGVRRHISVGSGCRAQVLRAA